MHDSLQLLLVALGSGVIEMMIRKLFNFECNMGLILNSAWLRRMVPRFVESTLTTLSDIFRRLG